MPKITIIGAGPGGLTSAILLQHRGFDVTIYEKDSIPGGRNQAIQLGDYTFDTGPTFLMMKFFLEEIFQETGRDIEDYLKFYDLNPLYRLVFKDKEMQHYREAEKMKAEIENLFPGESSGYDKLMDYESRRYQRLYPCLKKDYSYAKRMVESDLLHALPYLQLTKTMFGALGSYFDSDDLKIAFTFQAKYLGMSPWNCPALFTMVPYIEHEYGIYHVEGGLNKISSAMAKVFEEDGGVIHYNTKVAKLVTDGKKTKGVELENGEIIESDVVIINSDFAHTFSNIYKQSKKYSPKKLKGMKYSCSTFMMYLGIDKIYDIPHHNVYFADDYKANIDDITEYKRLGEDFSFYVQNASITDDTLAPQGHSTIYVLVPIANNKSGIKWDEIKEKYRNEVLDKLKNRAGLEDIEDHIVEEKLITPLDWERNYNVHFGATFNLGHNVSQMLYFRPHNKFSDLDNCYLVGGGTHPGSGLPTIYESGRISARLICEQYSKKY